MPMYNLLEYSDNYFKTTESQWNCYRDEVNGSANKNNDANNHRINNKKTTKSTFFQCKTKILGKMSNENNILDTEVVVPLNYSSNFWKSFHLDLIKCEIELDLLWSSYCIIQIISKEPAVPANPLVPAVNATDTARATFRINKAKLYVPFVTLSL